MANDPFLGEILKEMWGVEMTDHQFLGEIAGHSGVLGNGDHSGLGDLTVEWVVPTSVEGDPIAPESSESFYAVGGEGGATVGEEVIVDGGVTTSVEDQETGVLVPRPSSFFLGSKPLPSLLPRKKEEKRVSYRLPKGDFCEITKGLDSREGSCWLSF